MARFAHLADCHIGAWREPKMRALADEALSEAVGQILRADVDFVVLAGDLFNTALPGIDHVRHVVKEFTRLKNAGIPVYFVAGSHDYSPTGKTMLSVLEEAGLCTDLFCGEVVDERLRLSFTVDEGTGVKLTGILGRASQLDREHYEDLDRSLLEDEDGVKVFVFHTTLDELKPPSMSAVDSHSVSYLPEGFGYYAGGHVHIVEDASLEGYENVVYPGPLFPASFSELEELGHGGFFIVDTDGWDKERVEVAVRPVKTVSLDCSDLNPDQVEERLEEELSGDLSDRVVLVRLSGRLSSGAAAEVDFRSLFLDCERRGAYFCMKNTARLSSPELEEVDVLASSAEEVERKVVSESVGQVPLGLSGAEEERLFLELLRVLSSSQNEGETKSDYERRVVEAGRDALG